MRLKNAGNIAKEGAVGASNGKGLIPSRLPCDFDTSSAGKLWTDSSHLPGSAISPDFPHFSWIERLIGSVSMASPRTRRVLQEIRPRDENNVSRR